MRESTIAVATGARRRAGCCGGDHLSEREVAVLVCMAAGHSIAATARLLHLSAATVGAHVTRLHTRLGVGSRGALVAKAIHLGVVDVDAWPPSATGGRCLLPLRPPVAAGSR